MLDYFYFKRALRVDLLHHRLVHFFLGPRNLQHSPPAPQLKHIYVIPVMLSNCPRFTSSHSNGKDQGSDHLDLGLLGESTAFHKVFDFYHSHSGQIKSSLDFFRGCTVHVDQTAKEVERLDHLYFISIHLEFTSVICHHHFGLLDVQIKSCIHTLSLTFVIGIFKSSLLSAMRVASSAYRRLVNLNLPTLTSRTSSSNSALCMIFSAQRLKRYGIGCIPV